MIPRPFIDELISRCDIVELIDARVPLRKSGSNYTARCPFHDEKTPSFSVSATKQFYHCFGCGVSGNAISFLMEYERLDFIAAVEVLAAQLGMTVPQESPNSKSQAPIQQDLYQLLEQVAHYYQAQLRQHPIAIEYLKQRGLSGQICKEYGIGYAPAGWDPLLKHLGVSTQSQLLTTGMLIQKESGGYYDRFRDRIMFPIRDQRGRIIGFGGRVISEGTPKYLNSPETPLFQKGRELYGLYEARKAQRDLPYVLVVEGYMDVVALAQHEIHQVVATLGTATTAEHIQRLMRNTNEIIFCFDGDEAGKNAGWRALETALSVLHDGLQIRFMFLPQGDDPDSCVRKEGAPAFMTRIKAAITLPDFFFGHLCSQVSLGKMDGKARLVKLALPLIQQMPQGAFQHIMLGRLSQLVHLDSEKLSALANLPQQGTKSRFLRASKRGSANSPMRVAIALLVQYPGLVETIDQEWLKPITHLPGGQLLYQIVEVLQASPELTTGALLEYWREREEISLLKKLAVWQYQGPPDGVAAEFQGSLQRLMQQVREHQIDGLLVKAQQGSLSHSEKQLLQQLISEKAI